MHPICVCRIESLGRWFLVCVCVCVFVLLCPGLVRSMGPVGCHWGPPLHHPPPPRPVVCCSLVGLCWIVCSHCWSGWSMKWSRLHANTHTAAFECAPTFRAAVAMANVCECVWVVRVVRWLRVRVSAAAVRLRRPSSAGRWPHDSRVCAATHTHTKKQTHPTPPSRLPLDHLPRMFVGSLDGRNLRRRLCVRVLMLVWCPPTNKKNTPRTGPVNWLHVHWIIVGLVWLRRMLRRLSAMDRGLVFCCAK